LKTSNTYQKKVFYALFAMLSALCLHRNLRGAILPKHSLPWLPLTQKEVLPRQKTP
jgi:hypothetical protein